MATSTPEATGSERRDPVGSRWWYWIAAVPVMGVLGFLFAVFVVFATLTAFAPQLIFALALPLVGVGLLVGLVGAAAFYFDSRAVADANLAGWEPDPVLWGVIGVAGLFFPLLQMGAAVYYLYQRHEHVGTP